VFHFPDRETLGECPACHQPVRLRGSYYTCDSGRACPFIVPLTMQGREIPAEAVRELLAKGRSGVLDGFEVGGDGDSGQTHSAMLEWRGGRVTLLHVDTRVAPGPAGPCPRCGKPVRFDPTKAGWVCGSCSFHLPPKVARRELRHQEVADLLGKGRTARLHGFRQRSGKVFKAALVLEPDGNLSFDFTRTPDDEVRVVPAGGPRPAFDEPVTCPVCLSKAEVDPGYVIAGREAWGCSRWREGCKLRVPFVVEGTTIPDDEAKRLFSSKKATRYLKEPIGPPGKRMTSRIVLNPDEDPCWTVEVKRARRRR